MVDLQWDSPPPDGATQYSFSRDCKQIIQFIIKVARFILHESKGENP